MVAAAAAVTTTENEEVNEQAETTPAAKDGARKAEANRKKKERQKAKARAEKAAFGGVLPSAEAVAAAVASAPTMRSERRHAGENMPGEDRGLGMFTTEAVSAGDVIASATPALSVVFDESAAEVCGFCFACEEPSQTEEAVVLQRTATGFGLILDDRPGAGGGAALIAGVVKGSPNSGAVFIGDRIVSIDGAAVDGGHEGAISQLRAACERLGEGAGVPCVLSRPSRVLCQGCSKFCACTGCVKAGRLEWHAHECRAFQGLPPRAKAEGDTSVLRLLLRFRVTLEPEVGEWSHAKESTTALTSLQRNPVNLDRSQLATLASLTGVTSNDAGPLVMMATLTMAALTMATLTMATLTMDALTMAALTMTQARSSRWCGPTRARSSAAARRPAARSPPWWAGTTTTARPTPQRRSWKMGGSPYAPCATRPRARRCPSRASTSPWPWPYPRTFPWP